jgi:hypothetical protein
MAVGGFAFINLPGFLPSQWANIAIVAISLPSLLVFLFSIWQLRGFAFTNYVHVVGDCRMRINIPTTGK